MTLADIVILVLAVGLAVLTVVSVVRSRDKCAGCPRRGDGCSSCDKNEKPPV